MGMRKVFIFLISIKEILNLFVLDEFLDKMKFPTFLRV
jgi:hypothetical protein